ncbi:MAG: GGDEF domain-containing protein, partial [Erysipelotrichia bacterium]|nr:GGDEF domain-containing protein [Erysipelotrichia bacterium]
FISLLIPALLYTILKINEQKYKMIEMSYQDYLTELYNGRKMSSVLTKLLKDDEAFTLIYLDIDRFKEVNDTYGHTIGDQLLKEMAIRIKKALREEDYAFRIGGDEFVVILFAIDDPVPFIDNFKAVLLKPLQLDKFQYQPKISLGYARYPQDASSKEELIRRADAKMYQMKKKKI